MKNTTTLKSILLLLVMIILAPNSHISAQQNKKYGMLSFNKAVNISGKQRMLSQKMTKSYLYLIRNSSDITAKKDLLTSKIIFEKQNNIIRQNSNFGATKVKLDKVDLIWKEFKKLLETTPNYDNGKKLISLNTDLLKATNEVVSAVINESRITNQNISDVFEDDSSMETDLDLKQIINTAGRQRMLAQRLALYYYANQTTLKDKGSEQMLLNVYNELDGAITLLLISEFNNQQVEEKLGIAMSKWEKIKTNKSKLTSQGFKPSEIYKISDKLTKAFNAVTVAYEKVKI